LRVLLVCVVAGCAGETTTGSDTGAPPDIATDDWPAAWADYEDEVLRLVNQHRFVGGSCGGEGMPAVGPLEMDEVLRGVARSYSAQMAENGFFDHVDPWGRDPSDRIASAGFTGSQPWGENIAMGYPTAEDVVVGWMNSPGHCMNILEGAYGVIGIGYYLDEDDPYAGPLWTQNFAGSH
jgi:uncharacterized protein YkwD